MFYQVFVVGDTSIDNNPPDQPLNFVPLEEFTSVGGGILAVESPVGNPDTVTEANVFAGFEACVDRLYPSMARTTERSDEAAVQAVRG